MATKQEVFTKAEVWKIKRAIELAMVDDSYPSTLYEIIAGTAISAAAGWATGGLSMAGVVAGDLICSICEVKGASLTMDFFQMISNVYAVFVDYPDYDKVIIETSYAQLDIPAKRGWDGGTIDVYTNIPIEKAYHTSNGWLYV